MIEIAQNKFNETEVSAFITVFMIRSITLEEMAEKVSEKLC